MNDSNNEKTEVVYTIDRALTPDESTMISGGSFTYGSIPPIDLSYPYNTGNLIIDNSSIDWGTLALSPITYGNVNISNKGIEMTEDADIKIGDFSLKESLTRIEERLNILTVNHELEKDWESLRILGQRYRELEKEIIEKMNVWDLLKKD
jgi:hypothetical protein